MKKEEMRKDNKVEVTEDKENNEKQNLDVINDLSRWRIDPDYLKAAGTRKQITHVPVRKPDRQQFLRVHPGPEYHFPACIIEYELTREKFIVLPEIAQELTGEIKNVILYTCITRSEDIFLWPIKSLFDLTMSNPWIETAHQAAIIATEKWIRVVANQATRSYEILEPENQIPEPIWPKLSMMEILNLAFGGRIVRDINHEIIRKLRGMDL